MLPVGLWGLFWYPAMTARRAQTGVDLHLLYWRPLLDRLNPVHWHPLDGGDSIMGTVPVHLTLPVAMGYVVCAWVLLGLWMHRRAPVAADQDGTGGGRGEGDEDGRKVERVNGGCGIEGSDSGGN